MPNDKVGIRSFKYLIRNKLEEIEELENELEKVKEAKGMISLEDHNEEIKELKKSLKKKIMKFKD